MHRYSKYCWQKMCCGWQFVCIHCSRGHFIFCCDKYGIDRMLRRGQGDNHNIRIMPNLLFKLTEMKMIEVCALSVTNFVFVYCFRIGCRMLKWLIRKCLISVDMTKVHCLPYEVFLPPSVSIRLHLLVFYHGVDKWL